MTRRFGFIMLLCNVLVVSDVYAGPKGTVSVPRAGAITIDGDFSDWPLASYRTIAQQPLFPDAQGVGEPTNANGDHLVWDAERVGPFNGTDLELWEPDSPSEFGSSIYFSFDDNFLYVLGVFIDDELNGVRGPDGLTNFFNDGFEFFIDAKGDSDDLIAELGFPNIDEEDPNTDDFQFTFGLNEAFEPANGGPGALGAEVHLERGGTLEVVKEGYLDVRDSTDLSSIGGRDVAARAYSDLRAAGAQNPEILANVDETFSGYAAEIAIPFGFVDGFTPDHTMGFALFWRDVDEHEDPAPGVGAAGILWTDWSQSIETSGTTEDGNLFHADNWGALEFVASGPGDFNRDGMVDILDIDLLSAEIQSAAGDAAFDLDGNGTVDAQDLTALVEGPMNTYVGDSNLDGEFNSTDFVVVFTAGEYENTVAGDSTWATGDWNADGEFNSSDLVSAFTQGGYEGGRRGAAAAVPEPTGGVLVVLSSVLAVLAVGRRE